MGVGAGLYMYVVVVQKFTFAISSPDEFLFPIVDTCFSSEYIAQQSCELVRIWRVFGNFLRLVFSASRVQHISDLRSKFILRPHHLWKYGKHRAFEG